MNTDNKNTHKENMNKKNETVPIWNKYALIIKECAEYSNIGENRLRELIRTDGKYMFRYTDLTGKRQTIYSWKLTEFDRMPKGKKDDIFLRENESGARLHISATKGRNIRRIPLKDELLHILKELADDVTDDLSIDGVSGFLFVKDGGAYMASELRFDMCNLVREYNVFSQDKIEEFTPKTLRHTGCTMYAREGMDISVLQYIMGHKSPYTTMRFSIMLLKNVYLIPFT